MDDQNKNLILATALSMLVILVWMVVFPPPAQDPNAPPREEGQTTLAPAEPDTAATPSAVAGDTAVPSASAAETTPAEELRLKIETERLAGSINLKGGRIDDLRLKDYKVTQDPGAETVTLLSPSGQDLAYYALYGWVPGAGSGLGFEDVPGANTPWTVAGNDTLTPSTPVTLEWDNGKGVTFRRTLSIDENFMFSVEQSVTNNTGAALRMMPYGLIARHGLPKLTGFFVIHEGLLRMVDGDYAEIDYDDMPDLDVVDRERAPAEVSSVEANGWIGFTDHYWMTTLIAQPGQPHTTVAKYANSIYQAEIRLPTAEVAAGATHSVQTQLFAGAKEWETIRQYERNGIAGFLDSIDWGWFYFLTKPIFQVLHLVNGVIGNMGWAIIGLTLIIKALLFPLAYKSYVSMAKMKELQPEMEKIKERVGDDRQKLQQEMMALYKKEKVNPAAGCLPILLQIPIFFSLYKVIFVTIELRHAPWFGWITDLSAPDPSSILNLFGLLPYAVPDLGIFELFSLGILPILLGISMWLQQKLNPAPTDPTQAMIFAWMPWVFMFMLGTFASGLIIYWIANNTITFAQQYLIMRSQGYTPDILGNIRSGLRKEKAEKK